MYGSRWILLIAVTLLNLANYSHWIAFASVAKQAAEFYEKSGPEVMIKCMEILFKKSVFAF